MAEEILIAELRAATDQFDRDLKKAAAIGRKAGKDIAKGLAGIEESIKGLPENIKKFNDRLKQTDNAAKQATQGVNSLSKSIGFLKTTALAYLSINFARQIAQSVQEFALLGESLRGVEIRLKDALGSSEAAAETFAFLESHSRKLAQSTLLNAREFTKMALAARNTAIEGEGVRFIFEGITTAAAAMGATQDELTRGFIQLNQGIRKGFFDTEDLKNLSEVIPIFDALQEEMKLSGAEFFKAIQERKVGLRELILAVGNLQDANSKLAKELSSTVPASFRKMIDEIKVESAKLSKEIFDAPAMRNLMITVQDAFDNLKNNIDKSDILAFFNGLVIVAEKSLLIVTDLIAIFIEMGRVIKGVSQAISDFAATQTKTGALGKTVTFLESAFAKLDKVLGNAAKAMGFIDETAEEAGQTFGNLEDPLQALEDSVDQTFAVNMPESMETGKERAKRLVDGMAKDVDNAAQKIKKSMEQIQKELLADLTSESVQALLDSEEFKSDIKVRAELKLVDVENYQNSVQAFLDDEQLTFGLWDFEKEERERRLAEIRKFLDRAKENVQDALGDALTNAFKGQLPELKRIGGSIQDIFANVAGEILASFAGASLFEQLEQALVGDLRKGKLGGIAGEIAKLLGTGEGALFDPKGKFGQALGKAPVAIGSGITAGSVASGVLGPSKAASAASGAIGGALAGAQIGSLFMGYGAIIGAAAGAIIGAAGGLAAANQAQKKPSRAVLETVPRGGAFSGGFEDVGPILTPFGSSAVLDTGSSRVEGGAILAAVAEFDRAVARILPERMRDQVEAAFQNVQIRASGPDASAVIAEILQTRAFDAVEAVLGTTVAQTVAGDRGSGTPAGIANVQRRVAEALQIVRTIEDFELADMSTTAQAIRGIEDSFNDLIISAEAFGISTAQIIQERDRQIAKITSDFNENITQRILEIEDPAEAQREALRRRQEEELREAQDANANIEAVMRLHALERQQLEEELADATDGVNDSLDATVQQIKNLEVQLNQFLRGGLSPARQQLLSLEDRFAQLRDEALKLGLSTFELTQSYRAQRAEVIRQANVGIRLAIAQIRDPFTAALIQMGEQVRQFQQLADDGIIPQGLVQNFAELAEQQVRIQEAIRIAGGQGTPQAQLDNLVNTFLMQSPGVSDFDRQLAALDEQYQNLARALAFLGEPTAELTQAYLDQRAALFETLTVAEDTTDAVNETADALRRVMDIITAVTNPTQHIFNLIQREVDELVESVSGLVAPGLIRQASQILQGQLLAQEALNIIGGNESPIEQVAATFDAFIRAGNPLTTAGQALFDLTENFLNLVDASELLGLSTRDLEESYLQQAEAIRENIIAEIDASLQGRRALVEQAQSFLDRIRIGAELPNNLRVDEAQRQFQLAASSGDISGALGVGDSLLSIARDAFGSTSAFFDIRNQVLDTVETLRAQEQAAIEAERDRLIREETRQLQQLDLARSSLDTLQRILSSSGTVAVGIETLVEHGQANSARSDRIERLLSRMAEALGA